MTNLILDQQIAFSLIESAEEFPVDFEYAWQWLGYSSKQKAKNKLANNFEPGVDYTITQTVKRVEGNRGGGSVRFEEINLTLDCFKSLGMMAGTEKGKEVRRYFLECERIAKKAVEIISAQSQEIERLKLELELAQTQERLMQTTNAIAQLHGTGMVALILGKPEAVIVKTEVVEKTVLVDERGKAIAVYDGVGITHLAARYGFGKGVKANDACREWLRSLGVADSQWKEERVAHNARKLPREMLRWLDEQFSSRCGTRQVLIGE